MLEQMPGSSSMGSVKRRERRRNRKRVFHRAFSPKLKANSVMKAEMTRVVRRMTKAGPISSRFSFKDLLLKNSSMIKSQLSGEKGDFPILDPSLST
jgi:hypothetical protein